MINIRTLKKITNNGGLTLKAGKPITYKSGWQVATEGIETESMVDAMKRVDTKREAMEIGRAYNQISVLRWRDMGLAYC